MNRLDSLIPRFIAIGAEAQMRSTAEMWHLRAGKPPVERFLKTSLGFLMHSETVRELPIKRIAKAFSAQAAFIGAGCEQIVVSDGKNVSKVVLRSLALDKSETHQLANTLQQDSDTCQNYLGSFWQPTSFRVVRISDMDTEAVIADQDFLDADHFYDSSDDIPTSTFVRDLGNRIMDLHEDKGLYPDIIGRRNLANVVLSDVPLRIVDTLPATIAAQAVIPLGEQQTVGQIIEQKVARWVLAA